MPRRASGSEFFSYMANASVSGAGDKRIGTATIYGAAGMTPERRKEVADWLRKEADALEKDGHTYGSVYVTRFFVEARTVPRLRYRRAI